MSTTCSATASGRDQVPSNETNLKNQMCLFVLTRKDGTPFDVTSVSEEDIIEICIRLGHTHPLGVLCYSATESGALFHSTEDMQCATCRAIKALELWDEATAIRAMSPLETHIRVYMIAVRGDPSKSQSPLSEGEGEPHSPTDNPHLSGETLHHLQAELGGLTNHKLHQLMEDLCHKITLCELNAPPRSPPPMPWGHPSGSGNPNEDDQVTFLWGGGWVLLGQLSPSPAPAWLDGGWAPLGDHPLNPHFLVNLIQMWGAWSILWHWDYAWVPGE